MLLFLSHFDAVFPTINRDEPVYVTGTKLVRGPCACGKKIQRIFLKLSMAKALGVLASKSKPAAKGR